jgi:hypothetical protein
VHRTRVRVVRDALDANDTIALESPLRLASARAAA